MKHIDYAKGKKLKVDDKWSISYDPDNNDRPLKLFRYGQDAYVDMHNQKNYVISMFYRILKEAQVESLQNKPTKETKDD